MARTNINLPIETSYVPVDSRTNSLKTLLLPLSGQNIGRVLTFKDYYGVASVSTFTVSTIGGNYIDDTSLDYSLSNSYGSISFVADGLRSWRPLTLYNGRLIPQPLLLEPPVRYSFLPEWYSGTGNVNNIGTNRSIGAATVSRNSYTASPGFITILQGNVQSVVAPSVTGIQTIIIILRCRVLASQSGNKYLLDARSGLATGYIWQGAIGPDWTSDQALYYRDCVPTLMDTSIFSATGIYDETWHHICLQRAAFTDDVTYFARFSLGSTEILSGDIAEIMQFTTLLTPAQVVNNFNFFASRFGWSPVAFP